MNEVDVIKRKIKLKSQHLHLIKEEKKNLIFKLVLLSLRDSFQDQISKEFDAILSRKLDCIQYLLENWG